MLIVTLDTRTWYSSRWRHTTLLHLHRCRWTLLGHYHRSAMASMLRPCRVSNIPTALGEISTTGLIQPTREPVLVRDPRPSDFTRCSDVCLRLIRLLRTPRLTVNAPPYHYLLMSFPCTKISWFYFLDALGIIIFGSLVVPLERSLLHDPMQQNSTSRLIR